MVGCAYCRMEENGDFGPDLTSLFTMEQCWKPEKEIEAVDIHGLNRTKNAVTTQHMDVTVFGNRLNICFNGEFEFERHINYCPMCGRRLNNDSGTDNL